MHFNQERRKMHDSALLLFWLYSLSKYLANSIIHNSAASTFMYIKFPSRIQYSLRKSPLIIPKYTMPSGHSVYISTSILGCINADSTSHNSAIYPSSSQYRVNLIRILVELSNVTEKNDSVESTPGTYMYPLTIFLGFRLIKPSASSLLLNTHLTGTGFLTLTFMTLIFFGIQAVLDRKLLTSDIADIFHKFTFGLVINCLRVSGSPASVKIDLLNAH